MPISRPFSRQSGAVRFRRHSHGPRSAGFSRHQEGNRLSAGYAGTGIHRRTERPGPSPRNRKKAGSHGAGCGGEFGTQRGGRGDRGISEIQGHSNRDHHPKQPLLRGKGLEELRPRRSGGFRRDRISRRPCQTQTLRRRRFVRGAPFRHRTGAHRGGGETSSSTFRQATRPVLSLSTSIPGECGKMSKAISPSGV